MNPPARLADQLDAQTDAIIALWRETFERFGNLADEPLSRRDFADHIPALLDRLAQSAAETESALTKVGERQRALEAARAAADTERAKLRTLLDNLPVGVWVIDADGVIIDLNHEAERLYRIPDGQLVGQANVFQIGLNPPIFHTDGTTYANAELPLVRALYGETVSQEEMLWTVRGESKTVSVNAAPLTNLAGAITGAVAVGQDITERKRAEAALKEQRALAEASSSHKTRLLSALSHDARTPLNAVVLAAQLLEMHCQGNDNPEVAGCLRTIKHSVGNVLELLGDLLDLTKIDAGALPADVARFALDPVLAESLSSIEPQARQKGIDVVLDPGALAGAVLETDRSKLKQILSNLLSNALRYTNQGAIRVVGGRADDQISIAVEDTGVGIDLADQERIFDEFATLSQSGRPSTEGTGLGLAICRRLANLLKGEVLLESKPGQGSTFTLVLPDSVLTSAVALEGADRIDTHAPSSGLILVAEDHLTSRQTLAKVLRRMGYRVLEAGNGRDVLTLVRQERPRAVLMDVNMPVMDGIDATLALRTDPEFHDLPIFILTGDVSVLNQRRIAEAGVNGYLEKPVAWDALKQALASFRR
jgi:PAS domain S-box-containing protein